MIDEERLARAMARQRHGSDETWPNFIRSAQEAISELAMIRAASRSPDIRDMLANVEQPVARH